MKIPLALIACLVLPGLALASPPPPPDDGGPPPGMARRQERMAQLHERFEKRARMVRLLEITEALNLSEAQALKLDRVMASFDAQRKPLQQELQDGMRLLHQAAKGDASAYDQVEPTIQKLMSARSRLEALDYQMYQKIAQGLPPQKRAKLALVMARLPRDLGRLAHRFEQQFQDRAGKRMQRRMQRMHGRMGGPGGPGNWRGGSDEDGD